MRCYPVSTKVNKWSFNELDAIAPLEPTRCVTWTGHGKGTTPSAIEFGLNQVTVPKLRELKYLLFSEHCQGSESIASIRYLERGQALFSHHVPEKITI
jgi:hypothetical protein